MENNNNKKNADKTKKKEREKSKFKHTCETSWWSLVEGGKWRGDDVEKWNISSTVACSLVNRFVKIDLPSIRRLHITCSTQRRKSSHSTRYFTSFLAIVCRGGRICRITPSTKPPLVLSRFVSHQRVRDEKFLNFDAWYVPLGERIHKRDSFLLSNN